MWSRVEEAGNKTRRVESGMLQVWKGRAQVQRVSIMTKGGVYSKAAKGAPTEGAGADEDQRKFDLETRVITNENIIIPEMFHSCALNK